MATTEELYEAIYTLKHFCMSRKACLRGEDGECPLYQWCDESLIADDAPEHWKDPEEDEE